MHGSLSYLGFLCFTFSLLFLLSSLFVFLVTCSVGLRRFLNVAQTLQHALELLKIKRASRSHAKTGLFGTQIRCTGVAYRGFSMKIRILD